MSASLVNTSDTGASAPEMSPANLQAILNTMLDAVVTIDARGMIRMANRATERLFGFPRAELIGRNISILMPSPDREQHDRYIQRYLDSGQARIIGIGRQVTARRRDGTELPIDLAVSEVEIDGQRMFTGVIRDMTDRMQAERKLSSERRFADSLLKTANAIVVVLDEQGRIFRINDFMQHLTGYTQEEVRGRDWFEVFVPERERKRIRQVFARTLAGEAIHGNVNSILTRGGRERIIAWSGRHLIDADEVGNGVLAVGNDITELKEAERKLVQSERLAAIGQMVTGLAHESRNALQRSRACLEMLELDLTNRPDLIGMIHRAQQAVDELHQLYDEVRSYAAPIRIEAQPCNVAEAWLETWENLAPVRAGRDVRLRTECAISSLECRADHSRLQQVFRNILENSLAVVPDGGEIVIRCRDGQLHGRPALQISVTDNGPGLDAEQASRIFEPFYTTKAKGTGLGMAIAKRIVEAHGGEIAVGDSGQPGAEIVVTLPR